MKRMSQQRLSSIQMFSTWPLFWQKCEQCHLDYRWEPMWRYRVYAHLRRGKFYNFICRNCAATEKEAAAIAEYVKSSQATCQQSIGGLPVSDYEVTNGNRDALVPESVAVCPECGADLWVEAMEWSVDDDRPIAGSLMVGCRDASSEVNHRYWQSDWQPIRDKVAAHLKAVE